MKDRLKEIIDYKTGGRQTVNCWGGHPRTCRNSSKGRTSGFAL